MARKKRREEHENHERWLVSYADFITLLFAFFTSMYAISSVNEGKFRVLSDSLAVAFNPAVYTAARRQEGPDFVREQRSSIAEEFKTSFNNRYHKAVSSLKNLERNKRLTLMIDDDRITIRVAEGMLFEPGTDQLAEGAMPVLDEIAEVLKEMPNGIMIEGHTDNIPISTPRFPSNWDLSSSRALKILKYFSGIHKLDPKRLSATGYAEYRPIETNDTPAGRSKNRRVDILVSK